MKLIAVPTGECHVTVVVVSYNGAPFISRCLESLETSAIKLQVIVVDNNSTDDTREIVSKFQAVELISNSANAGFGIGCNIGISKALSRGADHILLLNQDAQIKPDTVQLLLQTMQANPKIGIACPLQFTGNGETIDDVFLRYYLAVYGSQLLSDAIRNELKSSYVIEHTPAAAWLISANCLKEVGGFDPLFFMYGEDDDMSRRAAHHGYQMAVVPTAHFFHLRALYAQGKPESIGRRIKKRTSRIRAALVTNAKNPQGSPLKNFYHTAVEQITGALSGLLGHLDWVPFIASIMAICGTALEFPRIVRHRHIALTKGAHWLRVGSGH